MARLVFQNGSYAGKGLQVPVGKTITIGRNREVELPLPDLKLSRNHCQLQCNADAYLLRDLGSTNGTFVNGQRLTGEVRLKNLDRVVIGDTEIEFQCPEELDELQTRVGMPAPAAAAEPSAALEPLAADAGAPQVIAPPSDPTVMASTAPAAGATDPLEELLAEVDRPLPPEPVPESQAMQDERPQLLFCDVCNGSIPILDLDLGEAKEISDQLICKDCLAKGVSIGPEVLPPAAAPTTPPAAAPTAAPAIPGQDLDDILKGLDDVEEIVIDEQPTSRPGATQSVTEGVIARQQRMAALNNRTTRRSTAVIPAKAHLAGPPPPPVNSQAVQELLGDDLEEIGEAVPAAAPPPADRAAPVARKAAVPSPPSIEEDEDLIEIGESGPS